MTRLHGSTVVGHEPRLNGATAWLNSDPLAPEDLRGHVVVFDFWTFTCINWLRTAPYLRAWWDAYRDDGLIIIGVHTPEFSFEQDVNRVAGAVAARAIEYPVVVDNNYAIWSEFGNHWWPAVYTVDQTGSVRDRHIGELGYDQPERFLQHLLGIKADIVGVNAQGVEAPADWHHLHSPETYVGYGLSHHLASLGVTRAGERHRFEAPRRLWRDRWAFAGEWTVDKEFATTDSAGASIAFRFQARDAHLVLNRRSPEPIGFHVTLDGEAPGPSHGLDVDEHGKGTLREGRMYQLIRQVGGIGQRTLEVSFDGAGAEAYVFTFG